MRKVTEDKRVEPKGRNPLADILTAPEIAKEKEVSATTVVRAVREGRLPAWEKGGVYLVPRREVWKWQPVKGRGKRKRATDD